MVAPVLADNTFQYTDTGVLLNQDIAVQPFVDVLRVSGLDNAPYRTTNKDTEGIDGGVVEADNESIRTIVIEGTIYGDGALEAYLDSLKGNYAPVLTSLPFYFKPPGVPQRVVYCKPIVGLRYDWDQARRLGTTPFQIQLQAGDPTIYASASQTVVATLPPAATTGRAYNKLYPLSYGGTSASGLINVTNGGNKPAPAVLSMTGPVTNPQIISDTAGANIKILISLSVSDVLTVDLGKRTVVLNGTGNRRNLWAPGSTWFLLQPGVNQLRYNASTQTASQLSITWKDAYR